MGVWFIIIAVIVLFILQYNRAIDSKKFIELMTKDISYSEILY